MYNEKYLDPLSRLNYDVMAQYADRLRKMGVDPNVLGMFDKDYYARFGFDPRTTRVADGSWNVNGYYVPPDFGSKTEYDAYAKAHGYDKIEQANRWGEPTGVGDVTVTIPEGKTINDMFPTVVHESRHRGLDNAGVDIPGGEEVAMRYADIASGNQTAAGNAKDIEYLKQGFISPFPASPEGVYKTFVDNNNGKALADMRAQDYIPSVNSIPLIQGMMRNPSMSPGDARQVLQAVGGRNVSFNVDPAQAPRAPAPAVRQPLPGGVDHRMEQPGMPSYDYNPGGTAQYPQAKPQPVAQGSMPNDLPTPRYEVPEMPAARPFGVADEYRKVDAAKERDAMIANRKMKVSIDQDGISYYSVGKKVPRIEGPTQVSQYDKAGKRIV